MISFFSRKVITFASAASMSHSVSRDARRHSEIAKMLTEIINLREVIVCIFLIELNSLIGSEIIDGCIPQGHVLLGVGSMILSVRLGGEELSHG